MATYRIVCTNQEPVGQPNDKAHIVAVGTGNDPYRASERWTIQQVISSINNGQHTFYTKGVQSGLIAQVIVVRCAVCRREIIKSDADAVTDNNLDNLRTCNWTS